MYKPRIVLSPLRQYSYLLGPWRCEGRGVRAYGYSPADAYRKWLDSRKREKQDGLFLARTARQAKEKRIKDREQRRKDSEYKKRNADFFAQGPRLTVDKTENTPPSCFGIPPISEVKATKWWWPF